MSVITNIQPIQETIDFTLNFDGFRDRLDKDPDYSSRDADRQQAVATRVSVDIQLAAHAYNEYDNGGNVVRSQIAKVVALSFQNSQIINSGIRFDDQRMKGYFLDRVILKAWFQPVGTPRDAWHWDNRMYGIEKVAEAPFALNLTGSTQSSMSYNLNGSAGAFGAAPMGTGGGGMSMGSSFAHTIMDFSHLSKSREALLDHWYVMEQDGEGKLYNDKPENLIDDNSMATRLHKLPNLSKSNFPLLSQVAFETTDPNILESRVLLLVNLEGRFSAVYSKMKGLMRVWHNSRDKCSETVAREINFASVKYSSTNDDSMDGTTTTNPSGWMSNS
ncbi:MAG: hypothetical protein R3D58_21990 [Saprospiraceae bacterium]